MYSISGPESRVLIATSTAPASGTAKWAMSISGRLGHRYATLSPASTPAVRNALATAWAESAISA